MKKKKNAKQRHQWLHIKGETDSTELVQAASLKNKKKKKSNKKSRKGKIRIQNYIKNFQFQQQKIYVEKIGKFDSSWGKKKIGN